VTKKSEYKNQFHLKFFNQLKTKKSMKNLFAVATFLASTSAMNLKQEQKTALISRIEEMAGKLTKEEYKSLDLEVFQEQNKVRANPKSLIPYLEAKLPLFDGKQYKVPGKITLVTNEGSSAIQELIDYLKAALPAKEMKLDDDSWKTTPVAGAALKLEAGMSKACEDHVVQTGPVGHVGHTGTDGSQPWDRMDKYGNWQNIVAESLSYGHTTGKGVVAQLLVDDGVASRGHRYNMMNPNHLVTGIFSGMHSKFGH
jgi:hypothetical protein